MWLPLCQRVADASVAKLNRPLTFEERRTIWRARSQLVLEIAVDEINAAATSPEAIALLKQYPPVWIVLIRRGGVLSGQRTRGSEGPCLTWQNRQRLRSDCLNQESVI
jgi:hypothetical protein